MAKNIYDKDKVKELNKKKIYTQKQILGNKFKGYYIDTYPVHFELWNNKKGEYDTTFEVRGKSKTERENYQTPSEVVKSFRED